MSISVQSVAPQADVVDDAVDAYVRWREECAGAGEAYHQWSGAEKADRQLAYCAYTAALDREEAAASVYAEAMRRLGDECVDAWRAEPRRAWGGHSS
ncbi:MAG TPA: hypothetical protein VMA77_10325 [Solirubrobacteraceae bacterium]|nr:hypothetical protein [Solirubrobacteraceae bacterium]